MKIPRIFRSLSVICLTMLTLSAAHALPSYARQTGQNCVACHVSFPELTPYGRMFKLNGYTFGEAKVLPFAVMAVASDTHVANTQGNSIAYPKNGNLAFEGASVFLAGKFTDHIGVFSQWTYNNLNPVTQPDGSTKFGGQTTVDNNDWRIADRITKADLDLVYGFSLNNNPTVQDVWNSTPAFSYPFQTSRLAGVWGIGTPATMIEGGLAQHVAGFSGYALYDKRWYAELGTYRVADGAFKLLSHGLDLTKSNRLKGSNNPYFRFAYTQDWGTQSFEAGLFGLNAHVLVDPTDPSSNTNRFNDVGFDVQYQSLGDPHIWTAQAYYVHERTDWDASQVGASVANSQSTLNSFRVKGSYWYNHRYGATLSYFSERGSTDFVANPQTGVPDTNGFIAEFNYMPLQNWRLGLQYTDYAKYRGASSNYDGNGRNAHDNNTLYLYTWVAF